MDAMDLSEAAAAACILRVGECDGELVAGTHLKVETSPAGDEMLDYVVPAGKVAHVRVSVAITETDA